MIIVFITNKSINRIIIWSGLSFTGGALETALFRCRGYAGVIPGLCRGYAGVMPGLYRGSRSLMERKFQGSWNEGSRRVIL